MLVRQALMLLGLLIVFVTPASTCAQEKLRLAWAGFSPTNSPIWVIDDRKLLQKQGVQPEIIAINNSPTVLQALLAGEIDAASISVTTLTSSRLAGADTVMIVGVVPTFVDHIVSLSNITAVEQLKGKTGGVNRLGTTSDIGLRLALSKLGVDPDKDVKIIPTGGTAERFAALSKGITQFTIIRHSLPRQHRCIKAAVDAEAHPRHGRSDPHHQDRKGIRKSSVQEKSGRWGSGGFGTGL